MQWSITVNSAREFKLECQKSRNTDLDDATADLRLAQELVTQAEELCTPIHDHLLELSTCRASKPLRCIRILLPTLSAHVDLR